MKKILLGLVLLVFVGCASIHSGIIQPSQVQFNSPNFSMIKSIEGEAKAFYFLGLGGLLRGGLIKEAKSNMYSKHQFTKNQIIANVTLDTKQTYILYPLLYFKNVIISADVIQFGDRPPNTTSTILNQNNSNNNLANEIKEQQSKTSRSVKVSEIKVGDILYFENFNKKLEAEVIETIGKYFKIKYSKKGVIKTKKMHGMWLYTKGSDGKFYPLAT